LTARSRGSEGRLPQGLLAFSLWGSQRFFFEDGELDLLFDGIDAIHEHPNLLAQAVDFAITLADDLASVFVLGVVIVD
jgi:hypothetical protein